jgi:hypothetical protein
MRPASLSLLDWGLAFAGIGIRQELIKLFEVAPTSADDPRVAAFLRGYGLLDSEGREGVEGGKLMLLLDGIAMCYGWADNPDRLDGIRNWLCTVKRIADVWCVRRRSRSSMSPRVCRGKAR